MDKIDSINNPYIKELIKLNEKKNRDKTRKYLIEGFHLLEMAKQDLEEIFTTDIKYVDLDLRKFKITIVSESIIKKLSKTVTPQPIIGLCHYKKELSNFGQRIVVLDNLQDPGNIGTILRSALAFNIDTIILSNDCVDLYNDKLIRSSQGAIFELNIIQCDILPMLVKIKQAGIKIIGTSLSNSVDVRKIKKLDKFALIFGNEGNGVKKEILDYTDNNIFIPMSNKIDSLNVSVAASILMYYFTNN